MSKVADEKEQIQVATATEDLRRKTLDDLPEFVKSSKVSDECRFCLAVTRVVIHAILVLAFVVGYGVLVKFVTFTEDFQPIVASMSGLLCGPGPPALISATTDPARWRDVLTDARRKVVTVSVADFPNMSTLSWWDSEELYLGGLNRQRGLTIGVLQALPLSIPLKTIVGQNPNCTTEDFLIQQLAGALDTALRAANRRAPSMDEQKLSFAMQGAMLIRDKDQALWSPLRGSFVTGYQPSWGWYLYEVLTWVLRIALTLVFMKSFLLLCYSNWYKGVNDWVAQYPELWVCEQLRAPGANKELQSMLAAESLTAEGGAADGKEPQPAGEASLAALGKRIEKSVAEVSEDVSEFKEVLVSSWYRLAACSPYFVLDHEVGNWYENQESTSKAILSSVVHALSSSAAPLWPVVVSLFFDWAKAPVLFLIVIQGAAAVSMSIFYYFDLLKRSWFFGCVVLIWTSFYSFNLAVSVLYIVSVVIFLCTRIIVNTTEVLGFVVPLAAILVYLVVVPAKLKETQEQTKKDMEQTHSKTKSVIKETLEGMGLSNRQILMAVGGKVLLNITITAVMLMSASLYSDKAGAAGLGPMLTAVIVPVGLVIQGYKDLMRKNSDFSSFAAAAVTPGMPHALA